jgi:hypothetical protein
MTHTAADIDRFHRALHRLCRMPELAPTINDQRAWHDFLLEMKPLEDTDGGPFVLADLTAVLSEMRRQNEKGLAKWGFRPSQILRDPEKFRDLVLMARSSLRVAGRAAARQQSRPAVQHLPNGTNRITDDPEPQTEAVEAGPQAAATFAELRRQAGL